MSENLPKNCQLRECLVLGEEQEGAQWTIPAFSRQRLWALRAERRPEGAEQTSPDTSASVSASACSALRPPATENKGTGVTPKLASIRGGQQPVSREAPDTSPLTGGKSGEGSRRPNAQSCILEPGGQLQNGIATLESSRAAQHRCRRH